MQDISVQVAGDTLRVRAPFNHTFNNFVADMGARWNQAEGIFTLPVAMEPHLRAVLWSMFDSDGSAPFATFQVDANAWSQERRIIVAGRLLAERVSTSRRPKLDAHTVKIRGDWSFPTGPANRPVLGPSTAILQRVLPASIASHRIAGLAMVPTVGRFEALYSEAQILTARLAVVTAEMEAS